MPPDLEEEELAQVEGEAEAASGDDGEDGCDDDCGCDEEDPFVPSAPVAGESEEQLNVSAEDPELAESDSSPNAIASSSKKKRQKSQKANLAATSRLEELSRPKPQAEIAASSPPASVKRPEKKVQSSRPSLLLRLRPINLEECWEAFEASGFLEAPKFKYAHSDEMVSKYFMENSTVCFELLPEAKRILQKVQDDYGGPEPFMQQLYGDRKIPAEEMRTIVAEYLKEHNIEDKVEIRLVDNMLSAANVIKPGADEKYVVNIANGPISWNMVQGICDHEVGTHLLRMMNDEHQVWHGIRDRYKLANPWTTEEGFATLNTYQSMPCSLMYPQALRYYAVCRGAQSGFVELFHELMGHMSDPKRCWQMCCRIKRGMIDTSLPGAFYLDQAYFKGAVEILRHLDEVDFGRLYGGQIALQDLDKVHFLLRKEVVRLPRFLNSAETLKTYKAHCRRLIKENLIETSIEKVCKPMFIRTAREFFKPAKQKAQLYAPIAICDGQDARSASVGASRPLDPQRLADLSRPRQLLATETEKPVTPSGKYRELDQTRVMELSLPRRRTESETTVESRCANVLRTLNLERLEDLAKPRHLQTEIESEGPEQKREVVERKNLDQRRLLELAMPRKANESSTGTELGVEPPKKASGSRRRGRAKPRRRKRTSSLPGADKTPNPDNLPADGSDASDGGNSDPESYVDPPPPPPPFRVVDEARLTELSTPRKKCDEDTSVPCKCPPKPGGRRKRRSKLRILAMLQDRQQASDDDEDEVQQDGKTLDAADGKIASEENVSTMQDSFDSVARHLNKPQDDTLESSQVTKAEEQSSSADDVKRVPEPAAPPLAEPCAEPVPTVPADEAPCAELRTEFRAEPKPRNRAVARTRSLGAGGHTELKNAQIGGIGAMAGGLGGRAPVLFNDPDFGACARRLRVPIGLPRGAAAAAKMAAAGQSAGEGTPGRSGPLWKAVPIKVMQFDFCGL